MEDLSNTHQLPFMHIDEHLSIPCAKCEDYIDVIDIQKHRELHRALKIFRCNLDTKPKTLKLLLKKRRQMINEAMCKADSDHPVPAKCMQKIDWAFEFLKNQLTTEGHASPSTKLRESKPAKTSFEVSGYSEKIENTGLTFGVCQCKNENWRTENEDRYSCKQGKIGKTSYGFFGVFDGYNGVTAAEKCCNEFPSFLIDEIASEGQDFYTDVADGSEEHRTQREDFVKQAIKKSFSKMDHHLLHGESETSKHRWSGASATVCYIENESLYIGNVGDVRALFVKGDGNAVSLVEDHILKNKKERDRVRKANGSVSLGSKSALVNGLVSSTRALGNHGDPNLKSSVICKPNVSVTRIDPEDQFLILFTAGVWEVFSDEEVMFLLEDIMPDTSGVENLRQHFQSLSSASANHQSMHIFGQDDGNNNLETVPEETTSPLSDTENIGQDLNMPGNMNIAEEDTAKQSNGRIEAPTNEDWLKRDRTMYKESKACFLARALVERLAHASLLAGSRENITATVILLSGCPVNLYLLPNVRRKSVAQRGRIKSS